MIAGAAAARATRTVRAGRCQRPTAGGPSAGAEATAAVADVLATSTAATLKEGQPRDRQGRAPVPRVERLRVIEVAQCKRGPGQCQRKAADAVEERDTIRATVAMPPR